MRAAFTVGQRKGLNIGFPTDDGKPRFVLEVRPKTNEVVVGPREALAIAELAGSRFSWAGMPPADPETPFDCEVQVRAHGDPVPRDRWLTSVADGDASRTPSSSSRSASPSTASPPARPPSSTSAPACSASARSTAP